MSANAFSAVSNVKMFKESMRETKRTVQLDFANFAVFLHLLDACGPLAPLLHVPARSLDQPVVLLLFLSKKHGA